MKYFFKFNLFIIIFLFSNVSNAAINLKIVKAEVTGRSVIIDKNIEKARRLALEDALYLASLQGGVVVEGFSSVSKNTILNDQSIIKTDSKILDFKILSQQKVNEHFEVKILAIIGSKKNEKDCKPKPINLSIFKTKIIYDHSLDSTLIRSMSEWNKYFINSIIDHPQINIKNLENLELSDIVDSTKNMNFDYNAAVNGIPKIEHGDFVVAPVFTLEPLRKYKKAEDGYNLVNYQIQLKVYRGPNFNFFKNVRITKNFQSNFPTKFQFISAFARKDINEMTQDVNNAILLGIKEIVNEFNCESIQAIINFRENSLSVNLGSRSGLNNRQIGIVENNYKFGKSGKTDTIILFISEISDNFSKLVPLDETIDLSKLNQMKINFIE